MRDVWSERVQDPQAGRPSRVRGKASVSRSRGNGAGAEGARSKPESRRRVNLIMCETRECEAKATHVVSKEGLPDRYVCADGAKVFEAAGTKTKRFSQTGEYRYTVERISRRK